MKLFVLAIGVHPDDVELSCSGTLINEIRKGNAAGVLDLTAGELGTRGTAETRALEAAKAAEIMGLSARENLGMRDGFFKNDEYHEKGKEFTKNKIFDGDFLNGKFVENKKNVTIDKKSNVKENNIIGNKRKRNFSK